MSEVAFAKQFISSLGQTPAKLSHNYVQDATSLSKGSPFILPSMATPMSRPKATAAAIPGEEPSVTVKLLSLRNPRFEITLPAQPVSASLLELRQAAAAHARLPANRLKILHNKRLLSDGQRLRDVLGLDDEGAPPPSTMVEFSVMVTKGAAAALPEEEAAAPVKSSSNSEAKRGAEAVAEPQFWTDLNGFLLQRVKDEETAAELTTVFKNAWESRSAKP
ncbi:Ubiquitin supergroup [Cordyceps fumosorosea ARSEF 2679]|uniref:Ubiquitin supergroup n=1 Tax=Cordyceps fumosorosea (strain ARSEF 2679) TaxID=1081104 RepID=A0A167SAI4_CORFA|nr:Ubiquitin supergroup [Cordyceps fumosorosea ARSEF 2679]OAA59426.1 Ubiquitin supergroup [Cordyceps fumosorosea ARSEF 2679]